ncbi:MAG: HPr-rel-A system PqqD family peptide chaperone [Thermaurantimonas sp.]|uniref:HPr-rel-A system PqqD family peptide chaperone n=1 Tax=Thermaurantimonas sp. TaxID=2681568 RepID=UPI00391D2CB2
MIQIRKNIAISDTGFLFDPFTGESYSLNSTGLEILLMLKNGNSLEEISHKITEKYDVDSETFERYFQDFISTLRLYHLTENE